MSTVGSALVLSDVWAWKEIHTVRESAKTFAGKDAEQYLEFLQHSVGILPITDLGNKLDDHFFRLKGVTGETMAE